MKKKSNFLIISLVLILSSALVYAIHYFAFQDLHHIKIYFLGDLGFLPIEVLLVSFLIHRLIEDREKKERLKKLNMVIGVFYSEVGLPLLKYLAEHDSKIDSYRLHLLVKGNWKNADYKKHQTSLKNIKFKIKIEDFKLDNFKIFFLEKRPILMQLLENPNLLEHESFTDLLMAIFHMGEELQYRKSFKALPEFDLEHLKGDLVRVYSSILTEWLSYLQHLKDNYPFLFSLAVRTNPFNENQDAIVSS